MSTPGSRGAPHCRRLVACAVLAGSALARADQVWTGETGNDLWTHNGNWAGGPAPSGAINGTLTFGPELVGGNFLVIGADEAYTDLEGVFFTGANGAFTISGAGSLAFDDGAGITNDSAFLQTINLAIVTVLDETVILDPSAGDLALGGVILGSGAIGKTGAGTLYLTGNNTYSGGTTLDAGTIALGHDSALGGGSLSVTADATIASYLGQRTVANDISIALGSSLTIDTSGGDMTLNGVLSGDGGITKQCAGTLTLTADNTFTGATNVNAGRLMLSGSIAGLLNVNDGGELGGTGFLAGDLTNGSGGVVAPGDGIGTLTVGGDYHQQSGSTLAVEINAADGSSDLLDVTGSATLAEGSTIEADIAGPAFIQHGDTWTIIQAAGGVTDHGAQITTTSVILDFEIVREDGFTNGDILYALQAVRSDGDYQNAANGGNNFAVGTILDGLLPLAEADPTGDVAALLAQLDVLNGADYNEALSQLTPEPYDAVTSIGIDVARGYAMAQSGYLASRRRGAQVTADGPSIALGMLGPRTGPFAGAAAPPLQQEGAASSSARDRGVAVYGQFLGIDSKRDTTVDRTGYAADSYGGQFGIDFSFTPELVAGISLGYITTRANLDAGRGVIEADTFRIGPYVTTWRDDWFIDASVSFGLSEYEGTRRMPMLARVAESDSNGYDVSAYVGGGYEFRLSEHWTITPTASMQYGYFDYESFTERGAAAADLHVEGRRTDSLRSRIAVILSHQLLVFGAEGVVHLSGGWEHEFFGNDDIRSSFALAGGPFTVNTGGRDHDSAQIGAGLSLALGADASLFVRYDGVLGDSGESHAVSGGLSITF